MKVQSADKLNFDVLQQKPLLVVISGPSGVGKDAVLEMLKHRELPYHFVITMTTRPPRANEKNGVDYFFVNKEQFLENVARGEMIEYAQVYNDLKGIPRSQILQAINSGSDVLLRVDVQGAARLRHLYPEAVLIFLIPTSQQEWYDRLCARKTETAEDLKLRLEMAKQELDQLPMFDYIVVNAENRLQEAVDTVVEIINCEHHKVHHRTIDP